MWLEWDRGTEPHARLRDKLDRYEELALALEHPLTLLIAAPTDRREHQILDRLPDASGVRVLTTTAQRHHADPLARNWLTRGARRRIALAELTTTFRAAPGIPPGHKRLPLSGSSAGPTHPDQTCHMHEDP